MYEPWQESSTLSKPFTHIHRYLPIIFTHKEFSPHRLGSSPHSSISDKNKIKLQEKQKYLELLFVGLLEITWLLDLKEIAELSVISFANVIRWWWGEQSTKILLQDIWTGWRHLWLLDWAYFGWLLILILWFGKITHITRLSYYSNPTLSHLPIKYKTKEMIYIYIYMTFISIFIWLFPYENFIPVPLCVAVYHNL